MTRQPRPGHYRRISDGAAVTVLGCGGRWLSVRIPADYPHRVSVRITADHPNKTFQAALADFWDKYEEAN